MEKRSVSLSGHRTSVSLEPEFWAVLKDIAAMEHRSVASLIGEVDAARVADGTPSHNLSSALRVFVLSHAQRQNEEA